MYEPSVLTTSASSTPATCTFVPEYSGPAPVAVVASPLSAEPPSVAMGASSAAAISGIAAASSRAKFAEPSP